MGLYPKQIAFKTLYIFPFWFQGVYEIPILRSPRDRASVLIFRRVDDRKKLVTETDVPAQPTVHPETLHSSIVYLDAQYTSKQLQHDLSIFKMNLGRNIKSIALRAVDRNYEKNLWLVGWNKKGTSNELRIKLEQTSRDGKNLLGTGTWYNKIFSSSF